MLDAIVCDPPYGVRAGGRKSQGNPERVVRDVATHRPCTVAYSLAGGCVGGVVWWCWMVGG